jgi:hypothetical protein
MKIELTDLFRSYPKSYCGDGVYVISDGFGIWLHTGDPYEPDNRVYLEPEVLDMVMAFVKQCKEERG